MLGDSSSRDDTERNDDESNQDLYSDDFEDEEKSMSAADATSIYSYASVVHAEHGNK